MATIIPENNKNAITVTSSILNFFIEYKLTSILQQCNAYKIKGLSAAEIFKYLLTNVFEDRSMYMQFITGKANFNKAIEDNPDAHPIFHSDRGFQYTNCTFHNMLARTGMTQSMSRVAHCIDNGPMEGFWGILKRECYYGRKFTSEASLITAIENYIRYYNTERYQRQLGILTPMEKHCLYFEVA